MKLGTLLATNLTANKLLEEQPIGPFKDEYAFLSNSDERFPVYDPKDEIQYPTNEHFYQAHKFGTKPSRIFISTLATPGKAKRAGRGIGIPEEVKEDMCLQQWQDISLDILLTGLRLKFNQNPMAANLLLATGNRVLVEKNNWGDDFFGMVLDPEGKWTGKNHLGRLLMQVRDELRSGK